MLKQVVFSLFLLVWSVTSAAQTQGNFARVTYIDNGTELTFITKPTQYVQIYGLPMQGQIVYDMRRAALFVLQEPPGWVAVPFSVIKNRLYGGELVKVGPWQPYMGQETVQWQVQAGGEACGHVFTSRAAAAEAGMDVTDLTRLTALVRYTFYGIDPRPCALAHVSPAQGQLAGLPVYATLNGVTQLDELVAAERPPLAPPRQAQRMSAGIHAQFLRQTLPPSQRAAFDTASGELPAAEQVKALQSLHLRQLQLAR